MDNKDSYNHLTESGMSTRSDGIEMDTLSKEGTPTQKKVNYRKSVRATAFTSSGVAIASFLFAAASGELALVEHLLDEGDVKVNDCDYDKRTALHVAAAEGHMDVVRLLIKEGANVNFHDRYNSTPLDDAIHHGHMDVSKLLTDNGAKHGQGTNFAHDLVRAAGHGDLKTVEKLVETGIPVTSADYDLRTPLHVAIAGRHEAVVRYLLQKGAPLDVEDKFGGTPLEEAHRAGVRLGNDPLLELIKSYTGAAEHHSWKTSWSNPFVITFVLLEILIGVLYAIFAVYGHGATAGSNVTEGIEELVERYPYYMDVHVMIFIGFGFLMTFLRKYGYTAVGLTFILGALCIQVYLLCITFWRDVLSNDWQPVQITIESLITADFAAGAVLISFGALLGKVTFTQMMLLAVMEVFFYTLNEAISLKMEIADIGGSMVIHAFGAFFGLAASYALTSSKARGNKDNAAIYHSDMFSMIGTIFLWMYWPSFNAALGVGNGQQRAVINTVLSLTASCIFAFIFSQFWRREKVFNMVDIQNATLAGGVAIGSAANMVLHPAISLLVGAVAGTISVLGFSKIQGFVEHRLGIHDTCGILNLHGMPGVIGAIVSMIGAAVATGTFYEGSQLVSVFPGRENDERSASRQAQMQLAFLAITLGISIIGGFFSGMVLKNATFPKKFFLDSESWETPSREVPYFFDIRGEAKHSNDDADEGGSGSSSRGEDKLVERAIASLEAKLNSMEDIVREQKRTLRQQSKQIEGLTGGVPGGASSSNNNNNNNNNNNSSNNNIRNNKSPLGDSVQTVDVGLASLLETLTNKVNFLVDQAKPKDE